MLRAFRRVKTTSRGALLDRSRRATPSVSTRSSGCARERLRRAALRAADRRRAARRRRRARHHRRAGAAVPARDRRRSSAAAWSTTGGHNILEPAVFGKPIVFGPTCTTSRRLPARSVATTRPCRSASERELEQALVALVTDPVRRAGLGAAARALVEANRGAKTRTLDVIAALLPPRRPRRTVQTSGPSDWSSDVSRLSTLYAASPPLAARWYTRAPGAPRGGWRGRSSASATWRSAAPARRRWSRRSRACCVDDGRTARRS